MAKNTKSRTKRGDTAPYKHPEAKSLMRPEVGTQAQFKKKPPKTYRYDSSLSPALDWDCR
jgi:adenine-specific DNA-methyltransferase